MRLSTFTIIYPNFIRFQKTLPTASLLLKRFPNIVQSLSIEGFVVSLGEELCNKINAY